jgi:hypothetical protein
MPRPIIIYHPDIFPLFIAVELNLLNKRLNSMTVPHLEYRATNRSSFPLLSIDSEITRSIAILCLQILSISIHLILTEIRKNHYLTLFIYKSTNIDRVTVEYGSDDVPFIIVRSSDRISDFC